MNSGKALGPCCSLTNPVPLLYSRNLMHEELGETQVQFMAIGDKPNTQRKPRVARPTTVHHFVWAACVIVGAEALQVHR